LLRGRPACAVRDRLALGAVEVLAVRAEVDLAAAVHPEARERPARGEQREVGVRAERAVADQQVARAQQRVQERGLGLLVREQVERQELGDQPGHRVEQAEHARDRQRVPGPPLAGVERERLAVRPRVGRERAGPVDQQRPVPAPDGRVAAAAAARQRGAERGRAVPQQGLDGRDRQAGAGLAVRGRADRDLRDVPQRADRDVQVQHLEHHQVDRRGRPELPLAPRVPGVAARGLDRRRRQVWVEVLPDPT